ncbi:MAG: hypothetical protein COZ69_05065, partial [Deltaproteobacteria bacterium CG_4_8_14_3_um_filter_45_9]
AQDRLFRMTLRKSPVVILSPSPCVTLTLSEPKGKGLAFWLRVNSAKNLNRLRTHRELLDTSLLLERGQITLQLPL